MLTMKKYLIEKKVEMLYRISRDFKTDFNIELPHGAGFTKSKFVYFVQYQGKKYVNKEALRFLLTNGDTYFVHQKEQELFMVNDDHVARERVDANAILVMDFIRNEMESYQIFPKLFEETTHFFVLEFFSDDEWEPLSALKKDEAQFIYQNFTKKIKNKKQLITPFYNQMAEKLYRHKKTGVVKMTDLKSLEVREKDPLAILMCDGRVNALYLLERRFVFKKYLLEPFKNDYAIQDTIIVPSY